MQLGTITELLNIQNYKAVEVMTCPLNTYHIYTKR
jgi:hypothetical protein